jgi:hypothetical protein
VNASVLDLCLNAEGRLELKAGEKNVCARTALKFGCVAYESVRPTHAATEDRDVCVKFSAAKGMPTTCVKSVTVHHDWTQPITVEHVRVRTGLEKGQPNVTAEELLSVSKFSIPACGKTIE